MIPPVSAIEAEVIVRLVVAAVLGACMGLERSLAGKHAGMRTYALVSLGSALFTVIGVVASYQLSSFAGINPLQIAGSIVIGIGFIGSGLAMSKGDTHVELTTAAGIWLMAAVGMTAGFGYFGVALAATVLGILIFSLLLRIENKLRHRYGTEIE
ncbi:MAG: MgtC family transporter [Candidatus Adlerbacteria bacterium]|nr:MgtC family transporter [Candidatus Adlerbacteria bacterium]